MNAFFDAIIGSGMSKNIGNDSNFINLCPLEAEIQKIMI